MQTMFLSTKSFSSIYSQKYLKTMFFGRSDIAMEKVPSSDVNILPIPFLVLVHWLVSNWVEITQNFISTHWSLLRSLLKRGNSTVPIPKNSDCRMTNDNICFTEKKDDGRLSREDVNMVMGNLGLFSGQGGEELKESISSDELSGLFDEDEPSLEEVKEAFNVFDENKDGFIGAKELQRVLCALGLKEGSELQGCKKMISSFDENKDGRIDFKEFVRLMEKSFC